jgi:preprotein translocase subunit SecD
MRVGLVCIVVLVAACSSSNKKTDLVPTSSTTTTTVASAGGPDVLVFREVISTMPFEDATSGSTPTGNRPSSPPGGPSCKGGELVTPSRADTLGARQVILPDREKTVCDVLGPVLLAPRNIANAEAVKDPMGGWDVSVHFSNDDFVQKIGRPMVGKHVAIIVRHVVWSAPVIQEEITTPDVKISGNLDEASARELANALR